MSKFLTAEWQHLIMANYAIDSNVLLPYLPAHTQLDAFDGKCYISLVGFMFDKVKIKGFSIPFHTHFPEINLRFYVKHLDGNGHLNRGVVFISEIVPRRAIAWIANNIYQEKYTATSMEHSITKRDGELLLRYSWYWKGKNNLIAASVQNQLSLIQPGTQESFIFEHYFGYAKVNDNITNQYAVEHPTWNIYPVKNYTIDCHFENFYGAQFAFLDNVQPDAVFVAEGSPVVIRSKTVLKASSY